MTYLEPQLMRLHFVNQMDHLRGYVNSIEQSIVSDHSCLADKSSVDKIHFADKVLDSHRLDSLAEPNEDATHWNGYV